MSIAFYSNRNRIYANFRIQKNGKKVSLIYFPGLSDEGWNPATRRFKDTELNKQIVTIEKAVYDVVSTHDVFALTNESFSEIIKSKLTGKAYKQTYFYDYCELFYRHIRDKIGRKRSNSIQTAINKMKEFRPVLTFEDIDRKFYRELIEWCNYKNMALNTTGTHIKELKRIMNYATDQGANTNLAYREFKKPSEQVFNIYLTEQEIESIYNLSITEEHIKTLYNEDDNHWRGRNAQKQIEALEQAKKLFIIGCWTGLRVENYLSIDPEINIDLAAGFIHAIANKNGPKLKIPIHWMVREIISSGFPKSISQQRLNEHIKVLGKLAGLKETIIYSRTEGGRRVEYAQPKYELITSHTARRSFCSNCLSRGIPKAYIMAVSGHLTEQSFNKYTQQVQKDLMTSKMADYDIWKKPTEN